MVTCYTPSIGSRSCSSAGGRHTPTTAEVIGVAMEARPSGSVGQYISIGIEKSQPAPSLSVQSKLLII